MLEQIERCWRVIATGIGFSMFGAGGVLMRVIAFPAINLFIRDRVLRITVARNLIRYAFRALIEVMGWLRVFSYEIKGLERLERNGLLILANHPTLLDTVFLMTFVKRADCIVKSALWNNPFTGGPVRAAGYIKNENGPQLIGDCIASLKEGNNLIIFPEGTRTGSDGVISLKRGAANVAVRGSLKVTPVSIRCAPLAFAKGGKWWRAPAKITHFVIEVQEDIDSQPFITAADSEALAARRLTDHLQSYFDKENKRHAVA
jgi:1-acyl-sn-glycerol-3-phosphate acyltransferase